MNEQQRLLRRIRAYQFSLWELHMFLDTHPNNCEAAKKMEEYRPRTEEMVKEYEDKYGRLNESTSTTSRWAWITGPWPWETGEEEEG